MEDSTLGDVSAVVSIRYAGGKEFKDRYRNRKDIESALNKFAAKGVSALVSLCGHPSLIAPELGGLRLKTDEVMTAQLCLKG